MGSNVPYISDNILYVTDENSAMSISVDTQEWFAWLETGTRFVVRHTQGSFTVSKEQAGNGRGSSYWRAFCRQQGKLRRVYLGKSVNITSNLLGEVAQQLGYATALRLDAQFTELRYEASEDVAYRFPLEADHKKNAYDSLLQTKMIPPQQRETLVERRRLFTLLEHGKKRALTVVSGPAGAGKTTLLTQWCYSCSSPIAWVSLDTKDNHPLRFWTYIFTSLKQAHVKLSQSLIQLLRSPHEPSLEIMLTQLINTISKQNYDITLILDDYHLITNPVVHEALNFLLDHLPPQLHLLLSSRVAPSLPLAHLRAQRRLFEIDQSTLCFTSEETHHFLVESMHLQLSSMEINLLQERSEGWITGLQLMALALQEQIATPSTVAQITGGHRYVLDYLLQEILSHQEPEVRSFLQATSMLERLSAPLCNAVTQRQDGQEVLSYLEQANLFLVALDNERQWYRYHHLFTDFLRKQLERCEAQIVYDYHHRASQWYEQQGLISDALFHAVAMPDLHRATSLIEAAAPAVWQRQELITLKQWIERLPASWVEIQPQLCLYQAWIVMLARQLPQLEYWIQTAERALVSNKDLESADAISVQANLWSQIFTLHATRAFYEGDISQTIAYGQKALTYDASVDTSWYGMVAVPLGAAYSICGDDAKAYDILTQTLNTCLRISPPPLVTIYLLCNLCELHYVRGKLSQVGMLSKQALQYASHFMSESSYFMVKVYSCLCCYYYEINDLHSAFTLSQEARKLGELHGSIHVVLDALIIQTCVKYAYGETSLALSLQEEIERILKNITWVVALDSTPSRLIRILLTRGEISSALNWLQGRNIPIEQDLQQQYESEYLLLSQVDIAQGNLTGATWLLSRLHEIVRNTDRTGSIIQILSLQALVYQLQGNIVQAISTARQALSIAQPEGYIRTFVDLEDTMRVVLLEIQEEIQRYPQKERKSLFPYIQRILAAYPQQIKSKIYQGPPLSEREREIVLLMEQGLKDQEIATQLFLATSTVKTYARRIYIKLGVANRMQAVTQAKVLNLL